MASVTDYGAAGDPRSGATSLAAWAAAVSAALDGDDTTVDARITAAGTALSDALPADLGTGAAGVGTAASRDDHVHDMPTAADVGAAATSHNHAATDLTSGTVATARLGTGTADSTTFLRGDQTWATPAGGGGGGLGLNPRPVAASGKYLLPTDAPLTSNANTYTELFCWPFWVPLAVSIDRLTVYCSTASAGVTMRLGVYNSTATNLPGTVLLDGGTVDLSTTGQKDLTVSQALTGDTLYWLAFTATSTAAKCWGVAAAVLVGHDLGRSLLDTPTRCVYTAHTGGAALSDESASSWTYIGGLITTPAVRIA